MHNDRKSSKSPLISSTASVQSYQATTATAAGVETPKEQLKQKIAAQEKILHAWWEEQRKFYAKVHGVREQLELVNQSWGLFSGRMVPISVCQGYIEKALDELNRYLQEFSKKINGMQKQYKEAEGVKIQAEQFVCVSSEERIEMDQLARNLESRLKAAQHWYVEGLKELRENDNRLTEYEKTFENKALDKATETHRAVVILSIDQIRAQVRICFPESLPKPQKLPNPT